MAYMDENNWRSLDDTQRMNFIIDLIVFHGILIFMRGGFPLTW